VVILVDSFAVGRAHIVASGDLLAAGLDPAKQLPAHTQARMCGE
jgi:hypothetical protein